LAAWRGERGDDRKGIEGVSPWWHEASSYTISSAMRDADVAFKNWLDSLAGRRAGRRAGYPRFKKKGRARDSFRIHHDVKKPTIRVEDARHVLIPTIGRIRLHSNLRRLVRMQSRGDQLQVQSVTVSRQGDRWYASILVAHPAPVAVASRRQKATGLVGVDLGVKTAATLSTGEVIENPRWANQDRTRLVRAQRAYARTRRGSANRAKAARRLGRIQARVAERRQSWIHQITKHLAADFAQIGIEDLNVAGMTSSAKGTIEEPGRQVRQKAGLNRAILDVSFGELRRQLAYKTGWYGSEMVVVDRWLPSSKTCSACGWIHKGLTLADRTFLCGDCALEIDRDLNAALNIAAAAASILGRSVDGPVLLAKPKPAAGTVDRLLPDTRDKRSPEAIYRVPTERAEATADARVDVGRPSSTGWRPPQRRDSLASQRAPAALVS
jgi:putative transposase